MLRKQIKDTQSEAQVVLDAMNPSLVEVTECLSWLGDVDSPSVDSENLDELQDVTQSFLVGWKAGWRSCMLFYIL